MQRSSPPVQLPEVLWLGCQSAVGTGRLRVVLWSYQNLVGLPEGVEVRHAEEVLPTGSAKALLDAPNVRVAHLADVVRLKAMIWSKVPAWFLDLDVVWLHSPRAWVNTLPDFACGHVLLRRA